MVRAVYLACQEVRKELLSGLTLNRALTSRATIHLARCWSPTLQKWDSGLWASFETPTDGGPPPRYQKIWPKKLKFPQRHVQGRRMHKALPKSLPRRLVSRSPLSRPTPQASKEPPRSDE